MPLSDSFDEARRRLEEILRYPPGAFEPGSTYFRDVARLNRMLGEGFQLMQTIVDEQTLRDRIEALHPDMAVLRLRRAVEQVMSLPRKIFDIELPPSDHSNGGR